MRVKGYVPFGPNPAVRSHGLGINMDYLFLAGPMPWPKHSFLTNSGPLLPFIFRCTRRLRKVVDQGTGDRATLTGILFVLKTGILWGYLSRELGCGSGMTCWRRLHAGRQVSGRVFTRRYCAGYANTTRSRGIEPVLMPPAYLRRVAASTLDGTQLIGGSFAANTTSWSINVACRW